ncbi:MAG TPA: SIMPL domain-containing protein [Pyrinomonadaceae bacterium]
MKFSFPLRVAFRLLFVVLLPVSLSAQQSTAPSLITVSGQAEVQVAPDEVVFTLEVEKTDKDLAVAKQQNDESVRQILALARRFGVAQQNVKTDYISVEMKYTDVDDDGDKKTRREFVGYEVSKTVIIRFTDIARFEEFFSEVLKTGISSVERVEFRTSQIRKYKDEARTRAIRAAREKATALTREIGQSIGRAHSISEENESNPALANNFGTVSSGSFTADEDATIAPGMIRVSARVQVSFILN